MREKTNYRQKTKEVSEWNLTLETHVSNKSHDFFHKVIDIGDAINTDQIGKFACTSKRGNNYVFVTFTYDLNL